MYSPGSSDSLTEGVLARATELAATPMFQLSTSGSELFHSNFLYWLFHEHRCWPPGWVRMSASWSSW